MSSASKAVSRVLPRLYAIADAELLSRHNLSVTDFAHSLDQAGADLVQYRNKYGSPEEILSAVAQLRGALPGATIILNDRPDLALLAGCDGVHLGQDDLDPEDARRLLGPDRLIGVSTHNDSQLLAADRTAADYVAVGPVFATATKSNPDPVVGLEGVKRARSLTRKPLVAIGGITRENFRDVLAAGADSVAVISGLYSSGESIAQVARDFRREFR